MSINPTNQNYLLPEPDGSSGGQTVSNSDVGNTFALTPSQMLSICPEASRPRPVRISNIGSIAITISDSQRPYPFGDHLGGGSAIDLVTSHALWAAAPPVVNTFGKGLVPTTAYVSVSVAS